MEKRPPAKGGPAGDRRHVTTPDNMTAPCLPESHSGRDLDSPVDPSEPDAGSQGRAAHAVHTVRTILRHIFPAASALSFAFALALSLAAAPHAVAQSDPETEFLSAMRGDRYRVTGLIQALGEVSDAADPVHTRNAFHLGQARLGLRTQLDSPFNAVFQFNFAGEPNLLDAYLAWTPTPSLLVRAGSLKPAQNLDLTRPPGLADFIGRNITSAYLLASREIGVAASWSAGSFGAHGSLLNGDRTSTTPDNRYLGIGRLEIDHRFDSAHLETSRIRAGVFGQTGISRSTPLGIRKLIVAKGRRKVVGIDARLEHDRWWLAGEWTTAQIQTAPGVRTDAEGGYATLGWSTSARTRLVARYQRFEARSASKSAPHLVDERQVTLAVQHTLSKLAAIWLNASGWIAPDGGVEELGLSANFQFMF